jgi:hypothetical protein
MQYHVTYEVFETLTLNDTKLLRPRMGAQFQSILQSGKVHASGAFAGKRGGFFIVEINDPAELIELLGPEILDACHVEAYPVVPMEKIGELFAAWDQAQR